MRDGRVFAYVVTEEDITALKQIDKAKTEFVSLASHQLQTPLASINWYAEILMSGDAGKMTARQKTYLDEIGTGSKRMAELVGALLNVSRIDMGRFAISPKPVDLEKSLKSAIAEQKFAIDGKHQRLAVSVGEMPESYLADPKLLHIIFQNLLSNAVKYTPDKGRINIACGLISAKKTFGKKVLPETSFCFSVSDSGFGIPRAQQSKIFTKLFRADNAKNMVTDGTGLGLYIVKSIIENAGGEIWFESEENKGSTFYFILPSTGMREKDGDRTID
jgi:signal transduction histidine kinase